MYLGLAAALAAWYNVARHYTGPERSGVAILPGRAMSFGNIVSKAADIPADGGSSGGERRCWTGIRN